MTISGQKQLSPRPTGERAATAEDGAHEILKEATTVSTEFFSEEATVYFLKG